MGDISSECHGANRESDVSGTAEYVVSWDGETREPNKTERHLEFYMKWDGCCHLSMGKLQPPTKMAIVTATTISAGRSTSRTIFFLRAVEVRSESDTDDGR